MKIWSFFIAIFVFISCSHSPEKVSVETTKILNHGTVEKTKQVVVIYSDSAYVRAKVIAPILLHHLGDSSFYEMPNGVEVLFYDKNLQVTSKVKAKYATRQEASRMIRLQKDVEIYNKKGEQFFSDEFIWDENSRKFYSHKAVTVISNGTKIHGNSFWANEDFSLYRISQSRGNFVVKD